MLRRRIATEMQHRILHARVSSVLPTVSVPQPSKEDSSNSNTLGSTSPRRSIIGTHNGTFHCDEALACALLLHTDSFECADIVRTRDECLLGACDVVVDVGAVYDPAHHRYDHHQNSFTERMTTELSTYQATKLSSAGLIYRHFGRHILSKFCEQLKVNGFLAEPINDRELTIVYDHVYKNFIEHIDGNDNGVEPFYATDAAGKSVPAIPNYRVTTSLPMRVSYLNPTPLSDEESNASFQEAMILCGTEFFQAVGRSVCQWLPSRVLVEEAFHAAKEVHSSGKILRFQNGGVAWKEHLYAIESENKAQDSGAHILFVLFADHAGSWRVQAVPESLTSFASRRPLKWCGLRDAELSAASGIPGGIFVHASGFIGGNATYEGALAMAVASLLEA